MSDAAKPRAAASAGAALARLDALSGRARGALALAAGAALTLAQPPVSLWPLLLLAWPLLFLLLERAPSPGRAARLGWLAGFGFFTTGLYWIAEAFVVEAAKAWWYLPLAPLVIGALSAGLALFWSAAFWIARRLAPPGWRRAALLGAAMGAAELARGSVLTGFPWALQAYAWLETPAMQVAALFGAYALTGLTVALAASLGAVALGARLAGLAALALLAAGWGWGAARLQAEAEPSATVLRLVQPNVPQVEKWRPENRRAIFDGLLTLSAAAPDPALGPPDLVVWPEVAVTFAFDESAAAREEALAALPEGAALALGAIRWERREGRETPLNSLLFYDAQGRPAGVYDKRRLVPFGEYIPYPQVFERLGLGVVGNFRSLRPGAPRPPVSPPGLPPAAPLICYETIFPLATQRAAQGAEWLLQVTNDAWFGESAGPWQHLAQSRARAIELGLPVARAANTGISAMIDPWGRDVARLGLNRRGVIDVALPAPAERTPFARIGGWITLLTLVGLAAPALVARERG